MVSVSDSDLYDRTIVNVHRRVKVRSLSESLGGGLVGDRGRK